MAFSFSEKTQFTDFTEPQKAEILATMQTAYNGSSTARTMFDSWITAGNIIKIENVPGKFQAFRNTGRVRIDLGLLNNASYIDPNGKAVKDTLLTALVHELGHALTGKADPPEPPDQSSSDYKGDNVKLVNQIYKELGLPEQLSYWGYDSSGNILKLNYQYTNGAAINAAESFNQDWNSSGRGVSKDLLIGGPSANILESGAGNDFLFGAGGNDDLNGGDGNKDTAVYFGTPLDYDIRKNDDGSWSVKNVRGAKDAGEDTLKNIEVVQFDGGKTYQLKKKGLTFQTDFALVIDTTGSMGSSIGSVKAQAASLIDAVFASGENDGRIGVVGFKDTTEGEPSQVILPFTDQDDFAVRKAAAIAAINGITVGGGGDTPETDYDGLRLALNGSMGKWRFGAGILRVALFTDAPVKDGALAGEVNALAKSIGATITKSSSLAGVGGSVDTFSLALEGDSSVSAGRGYLDDSDNPLFPFVPSNDPIALDPTTGEVQIFTIFTGPPGTDTTALSDIASNNGGTFLTAPTNDELVTKLLEIINAPPVNDPPTDITFSNITDQLAENSAIGTGIKVAEIDVTDDPQGVNNLSLSGADQGSFEIRGNELYYIGNSPDFETKNKYEITVNVDDPSLGTNPDASTNFVLSITNLPDQDISNILPNFNDGTIIDNQGSLVYDSTSVTGNINTKADDTILNQTNALFHNLVGLYQVENTSGAILDTLDLNGNGATNDLLNPGDAGYARTAITNTVNNFILQMGANSDPTKKPTSAAEFGDVLLQGGKLYAPFAIANGGNLIPTGGTLQDGINSFLAQNPNNQAADLTNFITHAVAYFSFGTANPDVTEHLQNRGNNVFGFEDLPGNLGISDFDFNDAVFKFTFLG